MIALIDEENVSVLFCVHRLKTYFIPVGSVETFW